MRARLLATQRPVPKPGVGGGIDWAHPLASRLCFAALFNEVGGTQCQSLVGLTRAPFTGSTKPSWTGGQRAGLTFPGGANTVGYLTFGAETFATDLGRDTSNPATWAFRLYQPGTVNASLAARNDGNTISAGWQIDVSGGASLAFTKESSVTNMQVQALIPIDRWFQLVIVHDGSLTATALRIYADGVLLAHTGNINGAGTPGSDAAQTLYVGRGNANYGAGNTSSTATLDSAYIWKRALTTAEVVSLTTTPYPFFTPPSALIGAGGGGASPVTGTGSVTFARPALAATGTVTPPGGTIGITQIPVEVAEQTDAVVASVTQIPVEAAASSDAVVVAVTQIALETCYAFSGTCGVPAPDVGVTYPVRRMRTFLLPTSPEGRWLFLRRLQILLQAGVGLSTGQGAQPYVMLQVSRDGGMTWGPERWVTAGRIGEYDAQAFLVNCGRYRDGAVRLVVSDPVAWSFLSADADLMEGTS